MVSTNVAEPDDDHATTLYRFMRHLVSNLQHVGAGTRGAAPCPACARACSPLAALRRGCGCGPLPPARLLRPPGARWLLNAAAAPHRALPQLHLPGGHPVDLVLAAAAGEMASGLLGTTSLTYQLLGRPVAVVKELVEAQPELNVMVSACCPLAAPSARLLPRQAAPS